METKTIESLQIELDQAQEENKLLHAVNEELTLEIEALKSTSDTPVIDGFVNKLSFENGGIAYGFIIPAVNLDGVVITAEQVVANKALQDKLIKRKSGMIEEMPA